MDFIPIVIYSIIFLAAAYLFKLLPNHHSESQKNCCWSTFDDNGIKIHSVISSFNEKQWKYMKRIGFKCSIIAGIINAALSVGVVFMLPDASGTIINALFLILMAVTMIVILAKAANHI